MILILHLSLLFKRMLKCTYFSQGETKQIIYMVFDYLHCLVINWHVCLNQHVYCQTCNSFYLLCRKYAFVFRIKNASHFSCVSFSHRQLYMIDTMNVYECMVTHAIKMLLNMRTQQSDYIHNIEWPPEA